MPLWRSVIDNIATYRTDKLQLDIERHTAFHIAPQGKRRFAAPRYSMMLVAVGALEPGSFSRLLRRPLSQATFKSAMAMLDGYQLAKETPGRVIFTAPDKRLLADWLPATFERNPLPGAMLGFVQLRPIASFTEVTNEILPAATADFNALSAGIGLGEKVNDPVLRGLAVRAQRADKYFPKGTAAPPRRAWRYLFEQE